MIPHFSIEAWLLQTMAMLLTALIVPGLKITNFGGAFLAVLGIGFVNSMLWDAALFFFLPSHLSLNVALLFLTNAAIFWAVVKLAPGIEIKGIVPALIAPTVFTVCNFLTRRYAADIDWVNVWEHVVEGSQHLRSHFYDALKNKR